MINKYGLYKTNVRRWQIPGLRSDSRLDGQTQGWWLPMTDEKGQIHMVDTYHINRGLFNYQDPIETIINNVDNNFDYTWTICKSNSDYYYGGSVRITEQTEPYFVEICDLREFEIATSSTEDYLDKDKIRNVQLWFEHKYPRGVTLLRKGAKKDLRRIVDNCCDEILDQARNSDCISNWKIEDTKQVALDSGDEELIKKINDLEVLIDKVESLNTIRRRLIKEFYCQEKEKTLTVIAIAGKAGIGKSTFSKLLSEIIDEKEVYYGHQYRVIPLAEEVKLQAKILGWNGVKDEKGRKLLQDLTKPIKECFGKDYYAKLVYQKALNYDLDLLIIDDLRFKAEADFFKNLSKEGKCNFITCKLEKDNFVSDLTLEAQQDISENDLNDYEFDYFVKNNGTLDDLRNEINQIVELIK